MRPSHPPLPSTLLTIPCAFLPPLVSEGDLVELDVTLEHLLKQLDVSRRKDLSVAKAKLATGSGFWKPRPGYRVEVMLAPAPSKVMALIAS